MTPKDLPELTGVQAFQNTDREVWRETPGAFYSNSVHLTATGGLGINVGGTVYVKPPAEWHRLTSGARSTALVALAPEVDDALREVGKWLNEQPNRPIDRVAVAVLCAALSCSTAAQPAAWDGAEEWEQLAWQLCAEENGEDACTELVWEGGAIPEPWGDRWMKYEGEAKRMISLVRQYAPPAAAQPVEPTDAALIEAATVALGWRRDEDWLVLDIGDNDSPAIHVDDVVKLMRASPFAAPPAPPAASGDSTPPSEPVQGDSLACGHHASLLLKSAETGLPLYCELCDAQSGRRDAETVETELRQQLVEAEETIGNLTRALREATEAPTFDPEGDPSGAPGSEPEAVGQGRWWRKKPVVIEAFQWNGLESGCQAAKARFPELETSSKSGHLRRPEVTSWHIRTLEGRMRVSPGDWIVRGVAGEFYPCKPDIFAATYEPAEPPQAASGERGD